MRIFRFIAIVLFGALTSACGISQAAESKDFAGTWVMRLGERNFYVLTFAVNGGQLKGVFDRPGTFGGENNGFFSNIGGGIKHFPIAQIQFVKGALHFALPDLGDPKEWEPCAMAIRADGAELIPDDPELYPLLFVRASAGAQPSTDWEPNRAYTALDSPHSNSTMKAIFDEDQRVRSEKKSDVEMVNKTDAERREQVAKLLKDGSLHTGEDYEYAAFIFQHGQTPDDYLLAHTLALVAVSKGDLDAIWVADITLDRYLHYAGQKQIFGTQFTSDNGGKFTQEPYSRDLISDALRKELGVPSQAMQAEMLKSYNAQQ